MALEGAYYARSGRDTEPGTGGRVSGPGQAGGKLTVRIPECDQDLEAFAHFGGMDQGLQCSALAQPFERTGAVRRIEAVEQAVLQQPGALAGEILQAEAADRERAADRREVDVGGDVLESGQVECPFLSVFVVSVA